MNVELEIKVKTMEDLERVLIIENVLCGVKIFPACFYDEEEKARYINIDDAIFEDNVIVTDNMIAFKVELGTVKYDNIMFMESLFAESGILFHARYNLKNKTREWLIDNITGPMEVIVN